METIISNIILHNWQQKLVAVLAAIALWFFINQSIMETKIIPSVPIRVVNIPTDHTILGLMPNGILNKRITLTITGTKDIVEDLEPGDIEIVIDASIIDHNDWVLRITKNNLVSLTSIDLKKHISNITHSEYVIKIRPMITAQIPITMLPPRGEAPAGYELLDVWPQHLVQTYSGAEEEIQTIKTNGLELQFDLSRINKTDLDSIAASSLSGKNEISFYIPNSWKRIHIPCKIHSNEELNDISSDELQIDFLRKQVFPIETKVPIRIFYPFEYHDKINPDSYPLGISQKIDLINGITVFNSPLYVHDVTKEFLDTIYNHLEIVVTAAPKDKRKFLEWNVEIVNPQGLEDKYIEMLFELHPRAQNTNPEITKQRSDMYRKRFREYMQKFQLYTSPNQPLILEASLGEGRINVN